MHYVYFIFAGYRVAIGKSSHLYNRLTSYRRTHYQVEVLGLIPCDSNNHALEIEKECLKRFKDSNAFRDMFYLSPQMKDWIIKNTIPCSSSILKSSHNQDLKRNQNYREHNRERYQTNPEVQERAHKRRNSPEWKKYRKEYDNKPEVRKRERERIRKYRLLKKKAQRDTGQLTLFD